MLEDFVGIIQDKDDKGNEVWESSLTKAVKSVKGLEDHRIATARVKAGYLATRGALKMCRTAVTKAGNEELEEPIPEGSLNMLNSEWTS